MTWVELFPFPEVIAKYGHGARNRYFPALCRDCAISRLGRGALETYCISSPRERYFRPGQIAAREWGPNRPSCTAAPNMRLTTSPSGITASFPGCMAAQKKRRAQRKESVGDGGWRQASIFTVNLDIKTGARNCKHGVRTRALTLLTFLLSDSCVPPGLTAGYVCICVHVCVCVCRCDVT